MSDLIHLEAGSSPWKPAPGSAIVVEYQYYDIPLSGVLEQDGQEFFFVCVDGADENVSLWWYVAITPDQRLELESSPTAETLHARMANMEFAGWSRIALATERHGLFDFEDVHDDDPHKEQAFHRLLGRLDSVRDEAHGRHLASA